MRLNRLIAILLLLESRGQIKARELAQALETSERTVYRDIETLCQAGVPIVALSGPTGGFSLMEGYAVNMNNLDCDDVVSLYLSGIGIHPSKYSSSSIDLKKSMLKLEKSLPPEYLKDIAIARERFFFDPEIWWQERDPLRYQDLLRQAVWHSSKVRISYHKKSLSHDETSVRVVRPYGLVVKNMDWYLAAYCETAQAIRVFRCDRILEAELLHQTFEIPQDFDLETFWTGWKEEFVKISKEMRI
ncbi:MAG: YafY family transcriptional regulator [Clostridia bacterium]|nr:YafY family transcriptional regulator [Clostridia bacterium]